MFGSPTGRIVRAERGERLPLAPRGFGWRLTKHAPDDGPSFQIAGVAVTRIHGR